MTENDILINNIIKDMLNNSNKAIEIILLGECKQNCEYCYLKKQHNYLTNTDLNNYEKIYNNLELILDWFNNLNEINQIDIFSGEWLTIPEFRDKIFSIFYNKLSSRKQQKQINITIPDNFRFITNDKYIESIQKFIDNMKNINVNIHLSISIDGKYCDNGRKPFTDEEYKKIFEFMSKNTFFNHSMISASNVKYWIQNYLWWKQNAPKKQYEYMGMLEVRDNNWEIDNINDYILFLDYLIDDIFEGQYNKNIIKFGHRIFKTDKTHKYQQDIFAFTLFNFLDNHLNCSYYRSFTIRAADLAIPLCHRLAYEELIIGYFKIENNALSYIEANIPELLIMQKYTNKNSMPHCENCQFVYLCPGPCAGASYEAYQNPLIPPRTVCDLFKAKYTFLILKYQQMGIFDYLDIFLDPNSQQYKYMKDLIDNILESALKEGVYIPQKQGDKNEKS